MKEMKTLTIREETFEIVDDEARKGLEEKQPKGEYLTKHQPIKTVNGQSLVGEGNLEIESGSGVDEVARKKITELTEEIAALKGETEEITDEMLLDAGITIDPTNSSEYFYYRGVWTSTSTDTPVMLSSGDKGCTKKFRTTKVPRVADSKSFNVNNYVFWKDGVVVKEVRYADISVDWNPGVKFDEVAINAGWYSPSAFSLTLITPSETSGISRALIIGDSISADYYGSYPKWVTMLVEDGFLPAATVNDSIHATGFAARYSSTDADDFITRLEAVTDKSECDLVVVFGGINDYISGIPMGEPGGDKTVSFKPAVDYFFQYLVENFTQARIAVLSPLRTSNTNKNSAGHHQTEYADYIKAVAKSYCIPVLNLTEESGFCPFITTFKDMWTLHVEGYEGGDGVHPTEEYERKFLAPMIRNFLQGLI